jgi:hypothetical protein
MAGGPSALIAGSSPYAPDDVLNQADRPEASF